ncbi:MAG: hypothetical protein AAGM22_14610 [Acidobacteriota bacterium]
MAVPAGRPERREKRIEARTELKLDIAADLALPSLGLEDRARTGAWSRNCSI